MSLLLTPLLYVMRQRLYPTLAAAVAPALRDSELVGDLSFQTVSLGEMSALTAGQKYPGQGFLPFFLGHLL